jgi:hypothetical protein
VKWSGRKIAGVGCGVLVVGALVVAGGLTWYSTRIAAEYKKVKQSEETLLAATAAPSTFVAPPDGLAAPERLEAFAGVREATSEWRTRLADEDRALAAAPGNWWRLAGGAHDLAQVMAGYWQVRNEALTKAAMGQGEYVWLYGAVYYGWLGFDPSAGRQTGLPAGGAAAKANDERFERYRAQWQGGVSAEAAARMEPLRDRLTAGWNEETNPVELIFIADTAAEDPTGKAADDR